MLRPSPGDRGLLEDGMTVEDVTKGYSDWPEKKMKSPEGLHLGHQKLWLTKNRPKPKHKEDFEAPESSLTQIE